MSLFVCVTCGDPFEPVKLGRPRKHCSAACLAQSKRARYVPRERGTAQRECCYCTQPFTDTTGRRGRHAAYCSTSCRDSAHVARANALIGVLGPPRTLASHKACKDCGECKPLADFPKKSRRCHACWPAYMREYNKKEQRRAYMLGFTRSEAQRAKAREPANVARQRERGRQRAADVTDGYIRKCLLTHRLISKDTVLPPALMDAHRALILIRRELKG